METSQKAKISGANESYREMLVSPKTIWGRSSDWHWSQLSPMKKVLRPYFWLTKVLQFARIPGKSFTQIPISPQWKKIEEDFWYPQKALEEVERLAPVSFPGAVKRH